MVQTGLQRAAAGQFPARNEATENQFVPFTGIKTAYWPSNRSQMRSIFSAISLSFPVTRFPAL